MSFGFGIGDIIACSEVAWKTINALRSAGTEFEGLRLDLASLRSVLQALEAEAKGPMPLIKSASLERQEQMRLLLNNCTESMNDLQGVVGKYRSWGADKKGDFVSWMRFAAKDKRGPREKLAVHTASINIFLTTLSHGSLARLEFLIKNGSQCSSYPGSGPVGTKGLSFAATETPWSGSYHGNTKRNDNAVWQEIGRSLQDEGIRGKDIEIFQEEIKAYARYLIRGETPFWKGPIGRSHGFGGPQAVPPKAMSSDKLRGKEEAIKKILEEKATVVRQSQSIYADVVPVGLYEPDPKRWKMREEEPAMMQPKTAQDDDVISAACIFERLFDFDEKVDHNLQIGSGSATATTSASRPLTDNLKAQGLEGRGARVREIQRRIGSLCDKRDRYIEEGRRDKMAELEVNEIPNQVKLLKLEGVTVSHERAWKWNYWCDSCNFRIPGGRYHCGQCLSGNWDICQECWDTGVMCHGRGKHEITYSSA